VIYYYVGTEPIISLQKSSLQCGNSNIARTCLDIFILRQNAVVTSDAPRVSDLTGIDGARAW